MREASRAVTYDYGNYSAHLFLANSFDALRDPTRFNLRYETVWFNELLLANLLAPVGAGALSQNISQQEYARLFEANRLGLLTTTDLRSDGQYRQLASQFGTFGNTSYSLDLDYQRNEGIRPNNELTRIEWYTQIKQQLTAQDSLFLLTKYQDYHSGDNFQYYSPTNARKNFSFDEWQTPTLVGGYHREWSPGIHTILLGGRLVNEQRISDKEVPILVLSTNLSGDLLARPSRFDVRYHSEFEIFTSELNQLFAFEHDILNLGVRFQTGQFQTGNVLTNTVSPAFFTPVDRTARDDFSRLALYAYYTREILSHLFLTAGLCYDRVTFPENHRQVPIEDAETTRHQLGPKAALVWNPAPEFAMRAAYARSLGGVSFDESYRLEPTQLAGFSQSFRTLIPESVAGSVSAPEHETFGAGIDLKFKTRTYVGLQAELLKSEVDRRLGVFSYDNFNPATASATPQKLDFQERSIGLTINQLVSAEWSFGAQYQFAQAELETRFPQLPSVANPGFNRTERADLHIASLFALFNHPSGFFARAESHWYWQHNSGYNPRLPGDAFVQVNCFVGYRMPRLAGKIALGVLNLTADDYRLNPLNVYAELPRDRVYAARLKFSF